MGGEEVPESWRGAINTTYRIGGPLQNSGWLVARHYSYETYQIGVTASLQVVTLI